MGCIGVGGMGTNDMREFMSYEDVQIVAVCDVVEGSREYGHWYRNGWKGNYLGRVPAQKIVEDHYGRKNGTGSYKGCGAYVDFREVLGRDDIDAVTIVTPDHWHAVMAIAAAKAGKHIYCEKPMTLTIAEGRAMVEAVRRYGVVFQTGSHERSNGKVRFACELVRNGRIGKLERIIAPLGPNNRENPVGWQPMPVPAGFDYDMWLGPAPWAAYHKDRCLYKFRFIRDYSGGQTTNLGAHSLDMGQWGNGTDDTGPVEVEDMGGRFPREGLFNTATRVDFRARYANGVELICRTDPAKWTGVRFEGSEGWVEVGKRFETHPESLARSVIGPDEIHLYESSNHQRNFLDCIKSRREPAAPVETGHRSATLCHLGNIAMLLGRKLRWDPVKERFLNDEEANRLLDKGRRAPWRI
jgi:predicted dehydrogenase